MYGSFIHNYKDLHNYDVILEIDYLIIHSVL